MLEGKRVRLRVMEKEDTSLITEWVNDLDFIGEHNPVEQLTKAELEQKLESGTSDKKSFIVEKKDGTKIGYAGYFTTSEKRCEIGFAIISPERDKGFCTEAAEILVDYLFLSKDMVRIQAHTELGNKASQKVLGKAGFKKEGTVRKSCFIRGEWGDLVLYSILREEWRNPKILTKARTRLGGYPVRQKGT